MSWIYRFEIRGIQSFVLSTNRLIEVAGGSFIVDNLFSPEFAQGTVHQSSAGSATIEFASKKELQDFAQWWPMYVQREAPGLELVQYWQEVTKEHSEKEALRALMSGLLANRNRRTVQLPELTPVTLRSARTGRAAEQRQKKASWVDRGTAQRQQQGGGQQQQWKWLLPKGSKHQFVTDHSDFAASVLAVVHIDGNDIGKRVLALNTIEQYKQFSTTLTKCTKNAVCTAIASLIEQIPSHTKVLPIRPVVIGGDDVTIILRSEDALSFTKEYIKAFETETQRCASQLQGGMTASAGIAFVKEKAPFFASYQLCESLCSYSKNVLRERGANRRTPSAMSFYRQTTTANSVWGALLERELLTSDDAYLSANPYLIQEKIEGFLLVDQLQDLQAKCASLTKGTLREWVRLAKGDRHRSQDRWDRMLEVATSQNSKALSHFETALSAAQLTGPWLERQEGIAAAKNQRVSPILDVLQLQVLKRRASQ